jgi:hypothetical protein
MKFAQELRKCFDARMLAIVMTTVVVGFGVAHWSGLRAAAASIGGRPFASLAYDVAFGQVTWTVQIVVTAAAVVVGVFRGISSYESRRLPVQLLMATMIFAVLNFAVLAYRSAGT